MITLSQIGGPSPFPVPDRFLEAEISKRLPAQSAAQPTKPAPSQPMARSENQNEGMK